jgi:hypothetical protein
MMLLKVSYAAPSREECNAEMQNGSTALLESTSLGIGRPFENRAPGSYRFILLVQREANLNGDLPVRNFAVGDMTAGLRHLKPAHVSNCILSTVDGVFYGCLDAIG